MNQLFQGDNLNIMRDLPDASIDLICTDPPFNTGKDWGAFDDRWGSLDKYLKFMEPRLEECRRLLKDTGSLYLHCDPTASHYLKVMLDGVFGIKQFRNEIVWKRTYGHTVSAKHKMPTFHDIILFYAKTPKAGYNTQYKPLSDDTTKDYKHIGKDGRRYRKNIASKARKSIETKTYLDTNKGVPINTLWTDINRLVSLDYPTQKPVALYARMIKASSNQHDVVLDPFAGSGTTLDAAQSLGRQWIGIDIGDDAIKTIESRLRDRHGMLLEYELITGSP